MLTEVGKLIINSNEIFEDKLIAPAFTDAGPRPFMDVQSASNLMICTIHKKQDVCRFPIKILQ